MWTTVYTAKNDSALKRVCALLDNNRIIYRSVPVDAADCAAADAYYDVLVPSAEVSAAHALILDEEL